MKVLIATLFDKFPGKRKIQPLLRFGHISLVPDEPIAAELGPTTFEEIEGYLVECLSWGGSSGAPVFVQDYFDPTAVSFDIDEVGTTRLVGLISGHYDVDRVVKLDSSEHLGRMTVPYNAGIALVVPSQGILDLIMAPDEVERRELEAQRREREKK